MSMSREQIKGPIVRKFPLMVIGTCSLLLMVSGCISREAPPQLISDSGSDNSVGAIAPASSPEPQRILEQTNSTNVTAPPPERLLYYGRDRGSIPRLTDKAKNYKTKTLQLNFIEVPADQVTQAIILEALGETVAIAQGVTGTITLTSPSPIPTKAALEALENVLSSSGLTLLENPSGYLLTTLTEAKAASQSISSSSIGYGVTILPIKNTSPSNIVRLITPFVSKSVTISPDDNQGVVTLNGAQAEVAQVIETIEVFDAPSLTDRVFGMFEIQQTEVSAIRTEIETLMNASNRNSSSLYQMIELPRLNRLFVVARNQRTFNEVKAWIEKLDISSGGEERRLRYYVAKNSPASILAQQISAAFGGGPVTGFNASLPTSSNGLVPGSNISGQSLRGAQSQRQSPPSFGAANRDALSIVPDELNNALIIRATDAEYREILPLLERMDVLPPQVLIEATIAEVTLTDDLNFGVRWFFSSGEFDISFADNSSGAVGPVFPGFSAVFTDNRFTAAAAINTLSSVTDVTVLSAPSIMVQNNQSANLQVGDEVPILTQQATAVSDSSAPIVSTIQLRETGVILDVRPRINASDMVVLDVSQEVSEAIDTVTAGINSPTIRQRQFTSTVAVRNNGTVALGGLIRETLTDNETSIPLLGRTPILGNLFKSQSKSKRRTELIIFLTPRIIRNDTDADKALNYLRQELSGLEARLNQTE